MSEYWALENSDDEKHRKGHVACIRAFLKWVSLGAISRVFSVYMCCRYGKSDTIRNLALLAIQRKIASCALVIHPYKTLAEQILEETRLKSWRQRWLAVGPVSRLSKVQTIGDFAKGTMCNDEWIGSVHIQAIMQPMQRLLLEQWIEKKKIETGLAPIIFFDESHMFSAGNKWGDLARQMRDAGCIVIVLTATPFRNDGDDVFGFKKKQASETITNEISYVCAHQADEAKLEFHKSVREETEFIVEADVEIPFAQGWSEGCVAKCTFDLIDWNMEGADLHAGKNLLLSEIPKNEARKALPSLYRDPSVIAEAARRVVSHIKSFRNNVKDATCIWYGMNSESSSELCAENQKQIKDAIKSIDAGMKVAIATLDTNEDSDQKATETIARFCDTRKKGDDILVLKQMGAAGLDSDRICVVVLWNSVRSLDKMIQMAMRGGNVGLKNHFVIVGLKDSITTEKLQSFIEGEGGKYVDVVETEHEMKLIDKKDKPSGYFYGVDVADAGMIDSDGKFATVEDVRLAIYITSKWPSLITHYTIPDIAETARKLGVTIDQVPAEVDFVDTTKDCEIYRDNLNEWVQRISRLRFRKQYGRNASSKEDAAKHGEIRKQINSEIKSRSGAFGSWNKTSKERSQTGADYRKWTMAAEAIYKEEIESHEPCPQFT